MSFTAHVASQFTTYETDRKMQSQDAVYTTSNGMPMPHPYESQRVGESGPLLLLQDFHLIDLLSHSDRERIPERVVHAKGSGAHGFFFADLFGTKGKKCPVTVRFSTVGGEAGSHDLARDPHGFAVITPVFFLRDPAKFPYFIHTQKRDPSTHLSSGDVSTMFWDYLCNNLESVHQVMVLLGDRGIPDGYRHMHGYSGYTFKFVNAAGEWVYVQIHMKSMQGARFITQEDSVKLSPDYSQKDLYEAIARGDFPRWSVEIQTMTEQQGEEVWARQGINVLDLTHVWPQGQFPRRKVGEFTLNENTVNYFAEIEEAAFNPAHQPPGIEPSADPVLQSRLFSYPDTHRHRIGRDGGMAFFNQGGRSNYLSSIDPVQFRSRSFDPRKVHGSSFSSDAILFLSEIRPEDFNAPRALWQKVWDEPARQRFVSNVAGKMAACRKPELLKRQIAIFREVDPDIASRLEKATGIRGYDGIAGMRFNGTYNGMAKDPSLRLANGLDVSKRNSLPMHNGAPVKSAAKGRGHANGAC
ncbi:catalase-like domain-containing protein [Lasiosphaeria ovina]|uniref:Catalase-like domain-containing protein n=1 Tax=Lasiosphaeria ovina TaxID=92902 RepID=A0AAE0KCX8_9PEZI|nr:catalase-like domain-containing protein [Lasiosphaeria ovina]